jgi:hypothetical protein
MTALTPRRQDSVPAANKTRQIGNKLHITF